MSIMIKGLEYEFQTANDKVMTAVTRLFKKQFENQQIKPIQPILNYPEMCDDICTITIEVMGYDSVVIDLLGNYIPLLDVYINSYEIDTNGFLKYKLVLK